MRPMQAGDVTTTFADVSKLKAVTGYTPSIPIEVGLPRFVDWYRQTYG
jgi:UDP-glucuronate 4-epimerase